MDLTKVTLDEFLAADEGDASPASLLPRDFLIQPGRGIDFEILKSVNGYSIVLLDRHSGDVAAVDSQNNEAGYYSGNSLIVHDGHRRRGLATALALWAYNFRTELPATRSLTEHGRAALTAAWRVANGQIKNDWWP